MASYNKVLLMGNITRDIELKSIGGGTTVANIGLAVNRRYTTQAGEKREEVTFVDCEAWGKTGENIAKFFSKGRPIFIEGRLKLDQWDDKEGKKHSRLRVVVESFEFVDSKAGGGGSGSTSGGAGSPGTTGWSKPAPKNAANEAPEAMPAEDIPF